MPAGTGAMVSSSPYEILSLDDPLDVRVSETTSKPVFWVSKRSIPSSIGQLADDFQGAWYQPASIVVRLGKTETVHVLPDAYADRGNELLKRVLEQHLKGAPPNRIQQHLADASIEQFLI
jgi:hypothetical protein